MKKYIVESAVMASGNPMYVPSNCFDTFAWWSQRETLSANLASVGREFHCKAEKIYKQRDVGPNGLKHLLNDLSERATDIEELRSAYMTLDSAVVEAYGWKDLTLEHGFHDTKRGFRFTICESARCEVLQRLLKLNHDRYAEEVAQGLHDKGSKKKTTKKKPKNTKEKTLF